MTSPRKDSYEVIIVGGGVSGLSAAKTLEDMGAKDVLVLERERECGGAPRHIVNPGFGLFEFYRPMYGPQYALRMRKRVRDAEVAAGFSVTKALPEGVLEVAGPEGVRSLQAGRVILAMGTHEASRHARLVSGARPFGIMTYGALQRYIYFAGLLPFKSPVVVGTEWVSYAAAHTMRKHGMKPALMIEEHDRTTAPEAVSFIASKILKTPIQCGAHLRRILGMRTVEGVEIERDGEIRTVACDGVVFAGRFIPESHLVAGGHLEYDSGSGGPITDQHQRLSDPAYFACGNVLRPVMASWVCSREGAQAARFVQMSLSGVLPEADNSIPIRFREPVRFVWPQRLSSGDRGLVPCLKISMLRPMRGYLRLVVDGRDAIQKKVTAMPDQIIQLAPDRLRLGAVGDIEILVDEE